MSIFATDWGHVLAIIGALISIGMDVVIAVIAWRLLRWHHGNGIRLSALEAWQGKRTDPMAEVPHGRRASDKAVQRRRASDRGGA